MVVIGVGRRGWLVLAGYGWLVGLLGVGWFWLAWLVWIGLVEFGLF